MVVLELVQAIKFKTSIPDANFLMLINFVLQVIYLGNGVTYMCCGRPTHVSAGALALGSSCVWFRCRTPVGSSL